MLELISTWKLQEGITDTERTKMRGKDILIVFFGSIVFAAILLKIFPKQTNQYIINPLASSVEKGETLINTFIGNGLRDVVEDSLKDAPGTYGVVVMNLRTGERYARNEFTSFTSASLYKLWVMGETYRQLNAGDVSPDEVMTRDVKEVNEIFDIDEEYAEKTEGTVSYSVENALRQMITISDNYAALLLTIRLKSSNVTSFIQSQGLSGTKLGETPSTTPHDVAEFYERLYLGKVLDKQTSDKMLALLSDQQLNDRIPKYLPEGTRVAHKTGELYGFKHDAGIIYGKDPILIVMMSDTSSPQDAAERMALLAKDVFNYFQN